jgi:hypothetical protein
MSDPLLNGSNIHARIVTGYASEIAAAEAALSVAVEQGEIQRLSRLIECKRWHLQRHLAESESQHAGRQ